MYFDNSLRKIKVPLISLKRSDRDNIFRTHLGERGGLIDGQNFESRNFFTIPKNYT